MNFLPLAIDTSKSYTILLILAGAIVIFFLIKNRFTNKSTTEHTEDITDIKPDVTEQNESVEQSIQIEEDVAADPVDEIPHIPGFVVLDGVKEQDAAVIMAITADKTGIPLERLDFKSIKRLNQYPVLENIEEQDAAAIMAITSDKTGIPLENLIFNSIKLVED